MTAEEMRMMVAEPAGPGLTLLQLAAVCRVEPDWLVRHVEDGLLLPVQDGQQEWRFTAAMVLRVRRIAAMESTFEAIPELAALVADLQEELDTLRLRLFQAGLE